MKTGKNRKHGVRICQKSNHGFTLIELLIVIGIIGVLAAIATPAYKAARERSNRSCCFQSQKSIAGAIELYNLDNNTRITEGLPDDAVIPKAILETLVSRGYLQHFPEDPGTRGEMMYVTISSGTGISCLNHGSRDGTTVRIVESAD